MSHALDPYRCHHCTNIAHFQVWGVDWGGEPFDWRHPDNRETFTGELVCRVHMADATLPETDAVDFRPDPTLAPTEFEYLNEAGEPTLPYLRAVVTRAAREYMDESVIHEDWVGQEAECYCGEIRKVRDHCNHGIRRTFYNTGRMDVHVVVPAARFMRGTPEPKEVHPYAFSTLATLPKAEPKAVTSHA